MKTRGDRMTAACALCNSISSQNLQISRFLLKKRFHHKEVVINYETQEPQICHL